MSDLPQGWAVSTVGDVATDVTYGFTAKANWDPVGPHMLRITDVQDNKVDWTGVPYCVIANGDKAKYLLKSGDLLFARTGATVGKSFRIEGKIPESVFASYLIRVRCKDDTLSRYMAHFFRSPDYWDQVSGSASGTGQPNVNGTKLREIRFPVPPSSEQLRIANKVDGVLSRIDACRARLDGVPQILKKFREAVLEAAISGRLTAEWRADRHLTETTQTIHLEDANIQVPGAWGARLLGDAIDSERPLCYGVVQPGESVPTGVKLIRIQDMDLGRIAISELRTISTAIDGEYRRSRVKAGDLLISVVGTIGRTAIVPQGLVSNIARAIARVAPAAGIDGRWLRIWMESAKVQWWLLKSSKEVARKTLNLGDLAKAPLAVPHPAEQAEIIRRVDQLFGLADSFQRRQDDALAQVQKLTPSVLSTAFRGELVPQDPNDEPADALLEWIRTGRSAKDEEVQN